MAIHKALHAQKHNTLITEGFCTEILYFLWPAHTITKCLQEMGVSSIKSTFLIVSFKDTAASIESEDIEELDIKDLAMHAGKSIS